MAEEIEERARASEDWPQHLQNERYQAEVAAWCWAEAVVHRLRAYLAESDPLAWLSETIDTEETEEAASLTHHRRVSHTRRVQSALEQLRRWETTSGNRRQALGLNPVSAARLTRDLAAARQSVGPSMAQLITEARAAEEGEEEDGR